ncbi:uncharacterized protein N7496_008656 [Penicillium cataractarum]|uniref:Uncharacterized protein n=1 Tax=Penicillium cataractarum TaxID=2100454 RepID=A0A9W9RYU6_9EURO|nr:uncharacterized protein N7496_008656 [Penicillium cataractarum]KAJ5368896.1 hypothetical protein N7496_008656 [Penicillium cataractarum]
MAPKRKSTDAAADVASKKTKASTDNATDNAPDNTPENATEKPQVPRSKRWSKGLSGSANADTEFRTIIARNPDSLWKFACQCRQIVGSDDDDEEDEDEDGEDEGEGEGEPKKTDDLPPCDGGKTCLCQKPIEEHPDHPYSLSLGGIQKFTTTSILCDLRNPDMFDMYLYNDFYGYGLVEVLGNLLLDFEEAKDDWKQQWYICEAVMLFFFRYDPAALFMIDDGDGLDMFLHAVRTMFLAMMATLERLDLLKPDSEIKNIGMVMGLAIRLDAFAEDNEGTEDLPKYLYAYAAKHNIVLRDVPEDSELEEPVPATGKGAEAAQERTNTGGDQFDITTMSAPQRKKAHFDRKDPLDKEAIKALKEGLVMQML